jgi:hypothetical protein
MAAAYSMRNISINNATIRKKKNRDYLSYLFIVDMLRSRFESKPLVAFIIVHSRYTVLSFTVFIRKCNIPNQSNLYLVIFTVLLS